MRPELTSHEIAVWGAGPVDQAAIDARIAARTPAEVNAAEQRLRGDRERRVVQARERFDAAVFRVLAAPAVARRPGNGRRLRTVRRRRRRAFRRSSRSRGDPEPDPARQPGAVTGRGNS